MLFLFQILSVNHSADDQFHGIQLSILQLHLLYLNHLWQVLHLVLQFILISADSQLLNFLLILFIDALDSHVFHLRLQSLFHSNLLFITSVFQDLSQLYVSVHTFYRHFLFLIEYELFFLAKFFRSLLSLVSIFLHNDQWFISSSRCIRLCVVLRMLFFILSMLFLFQSLFQIELAR